MARILITGAHGFIGRHLAKSLALAGNVVIGLGHGNWPPLHAQRWGLVYWLNGEIDIPNLRSIQKQFGTVDIVYHLAGGSSVGAAIANPREDFHRTVSSTVELLEWLRQEASKSILVAVSSAAVYGAGHIGQIAETARPNPFSPYGHHKHIMESLCISYSESYELKVVIGRLFSVYGEGLRKQLLWDVCSQLEVHPDHILLGGSGNELRDWTAVTDVVRALSFIHTEANLPPKVINIGTGRGTNVRTIVEGVGQAWAADTNLSPEIEFSGKARAGDPQSLIAQSDQLAALGFEWQKDLMEGLADYVRWFRSESGARS
ncbi:NAD-dependent epimerase/dehydratase family protein [Rhizobium leguminosarum bv. viciae]|uniref:NAD-dependent epimerase/dehydratase family protein n=1 Tax=Rhizobium laguerreae TaxID=1076926 RepID=A0A6N9ZDJ4_9HYPH|nr:MULTISPECIES: NAD-dependent epimerase/dehydratase [Rhizobium]MBX4860418.1 NAD-dependent epimerase/dehydratase [Rhizobium bangladeshense]NEH91552.1 NAD-dependent epimerase/dehydratase family protein [Rhizobium laguerreae]NKL03202.1 NAD-dependent epimerase/dehydratase family protein [Rhizobium leguminosarum bv. viciae]